MIKTSSIPQFPYCPTNRSQPRNLRVSACRNKAWNPPKKLSKGTRSGSCSNQLSNRTPNELCSWAGEENVGNTLRTAAELTGSIPMPVPL
jgi:hypothetical protein